MPWSDLPLRALFWSAATIAFYLVSKRLYRRWPTPWLMPLGVVPAVLALVLIALHGTYREYIGGTSWLVALLGPTTVAFAVPVYEQRVLLRRHWPVLVLGTVVGLVTRRRHRLGAGHPARPRRHPASQPAAALDEHAVRDGSVGRHRRRT